MGGISQRQDFSANQPGVAARDLEMQYQVVESGVGGPSVFRWMTRLTEFLRMNTALGSSELGDRVLGSLAASPHQSHRSTPQQRRRSPPQPFSPPEEIPSPVWHIPEQQHMQPLFDQSALDQMRQSQEAAPLLYGPGERRGQGSTGQTSTESSELRIEAQRKLADYYRVQHEETKSEVEILREQVKALANKLEGGTRQAPMPWGSQQQGALHGSVPPGLGAHGGDLRGPPILGQGVQGDPFLGVPDRDLGSHREGFRGAALPGRGYGEGWDRNRRLPQHPGRGDVPQEPGQHPRHSSPPPSVPGQSYPRDSHPPGSKTAGPMDGKEKSGSTILETLVSGMQQLQQAQMAMMTRRDEAPEQVKPGVSSLASLPPPGSPDSAVAVQDWVELIDGPLSDISDTSVTWWAMVKDKAQVLYRPKVGVIDAV